MTSAVTNRAVLLTLGVCGVATGRTARSGKRSNLLGRCSDRRHRRDEPIPSTRQRLDKRRRLGGITERLPEFLYRCVEAVLEVDERVGLPEPVAQILASDNIAGPVKERRQHLGRLLLQRHATAIVAAELAGRRIEYESGKLQTCGP